MPTININHLPHQLIRIARSVLRIRHRVTSALTGRSPAAGFDLTDAAGINHLLAAHGHPPLADSPHAVATRAGRLAHGEKVYEIRDDVRRAFPLALTPAGRGAFIDWFLRCGWPEGGVAFPDILRLLFDRDATPDRGLVGSYLLHPDWQARHPAALTPAGWGPFKRWVAAECRVSGRWLRRAALPPQYAVPPKHRLGANVLALFRHPSGLQQNAIAVVDALAGAGVGLSLRDIPVSFHRDGQSRAGFEGLEEYPVTILDIGLDMTAADAYRLAALHPRPGRYRVAVWSWELEQLPAGWLDRGQGMDEVWAPTEFIADALRPLGRPITTILTPVRLPAFSARPKSAFGLDPDRFTFLFVFDMNSRLARKNPLGLIRAFRLAFRPDEPVDLVLKVSPQDRFYADWWQELRTAAAAAGVRLIDRLMPRDELLGLMNAADAYVSLHRSEGVGLTMAEAMLMGKPVIATGYSGNLDFMTADNSYLVRYERVEIAEDIPPYPKGCVWAEPSVEHAATLMRRVVDHPEEGRAVAARGRADAERLFSPEAAGKKMAARLAEITRDTPPAAGCSVGPKRSAATGQLVRKVRRRAGLFLRGESPRLFFDIHDRDLIDGLLADNALSPLVRSPHETALGNGNAALGETVYDLRDDVRREIPLALTPAQRGAYLNWFLRYGRADSTAGFADVLRSLFECDAAPDRGLVRSYLVHPAWQARHPAALTPAGWEAFKQWVGAEYQVSGRWLRRATLPAGGAISPAGRAGVNVLGLFRYPSGLRQAATGMIDALAAVGTPLSLRDIPMPTRRDGRPRAGFLGLEEHPVTILNTGLDIPVAEAYRLAALHPRPGVYRIAMWWWELEQLPPEWLDRGQDVDEIWAPTAFVAGAMRALGKPVRLILPAVELPFFEPLSKSAFGLDPARFTFLFVFDMSSHMARKNPLGLIRAFRRAFRPDEPVELVIKVSPQDAHHAYDWRELRAAAADAGVRLIDRSLSQGELLGLMNAADAYVSLHRSEGFGLTMAEAMLLGKPTIATGYSGNLDFMTADTSFLVRSDLVALDRDDPPYPKGCVWADPSVEHAAELMRRVVADPAGAAAVAARGRDAVAAALSRPAAGARMAARLAEVARA